MRGERGGTLVLFLLWLPCLLITLGLVGDVGLYLGLRLQLRQRAEAAALAGARRVDWASLAAGSPRLRPAEARATAREVARGAGASATVTVWAEAEPVSGGVSGPGVRVVLRKAWRPPVTGWLIGTVTLEGKAAAALVPQNRKN